jgi:small subunit ribosomal protein S18
MEPKTRQRWANFRRANRMMPRRRMDVPLDKVDFKHPELLSKFTSETGKILPRRVTGVSAKLHRRITREIKRARAVNLLP